MQKSKRNLWIFIALYVATIYLTLAYMRAFINFLYESLGRESVGFVINTILILSILALFFFIASSIKYYHEQSRAILVMIVLLLGGSVAMSYDIPVERVHFLEYGILGYLVLKATEDSWKIPCIASFLLVSIIGAGDEIIQWFLPSRVGEMRDVFMNSFGGLLGITLKSLHRQSRNQIGLPPC